MIFQILGGVGLFLIGMILLSDGLKQAAGDALRRVLARFTGGRMKSLLSGVAVTTVVQSSSATTLTTIGFVSAGLLTFPQAVGVIFGANLGTTSTGWLVSIVGLKLKIGAVAAPLVAVGALMRLLGRGRTAPIGLALAGFSLIFVGIDALQAGMAGLAERIDPASLPGATPGGRLLLVAVGMAMTVTMQSSSAALATTLAALDSGSIGLEQGAALVIGQNVGTTVKAAAASIGASVPAKRTALAHIVFNVLTGIVAFAILPLMLRVADIADGAFGAGGPSTLAAFHSVFNVLGVVLLLPWLDRFSALIERAVPERGRLLTRHLDTSVTELSPVAVEASRRTLREILGVVAEIGLDLVDGRGVAAARAALLDGAGRALADTRAFMSRIRSAPGAQAEHQRHLAALHAADHLDRLITACGEAAGEQVAADGALQSTALELRRALIAVLAWPGTATSPLDTVETISRSLAGARHTHRRALLERTAGGLVEPEVASRQLEATRWIDRVAYHVWRAVVHLDDARMSNGAGTSEVHEEADADDPARTPLPPAAQ